jgi:aminoglycoside phosphotransferase (APT) family kinase protein
MPKGGPDEVIRDNLPEHPAVKAWQKLEPPRVEPESIHSLRRKPPVYRLTGVGPGGSAVIAKRGRGAEGRVERTVYEEVLPHLPVTAPRYYGSTEDEGGAWFFLEDVGEERYSELDAEHRALAARWLGLMHTSSTRLAGTTDVAARLPDGGPGRYLHHLRSARAAILRNLSNPALTTEDVAGLEAIVSLHDLLEARWARLEEACDGVPSTLVHGDFRPKNAYLRRRPAAIDLFPIDWETAGWGVPAADLTRVDVTAYWEVVRESWAGLGLQAIQRLATVGQVFRALAAIGWDSPELAYDTARYLCRPMACLQVQRKKLSEAIRAAGVAA